MNNFTYKSELFENYDAYENMAHDRLTLEDANRIFTEYHDSLDFSEEYFREEYAKLVSHAIRYAGIRAGWSGLDREEKMREDDGRTNAHKEQRQQQSRAEEKEKRFAFHGLIYQPFSELEVNKIISCASCQITDPGDRDRGGHEESGDHKEKDPVIFLCGSMPVGNISCRRRTGI